jgi:hypothetical protein
MSKRYSKKRYVYDKAAIQYYKQVPFPCSIKGRKVNYFFQLNSLLEIYEDNFFLNTIFTDKAQIFIDIGANV